LTFLPQNFSEVMTAVFELKTSKEFRKPWHKLESQVAMAK